MKITSVGFVLSAGNAGECPEGEVAEIAFSGRSNVGKSTLLNSLMGRRALAKVSGTPGKTQRINFFMVNDRFHLVDLPGYGYAKASISQRKQWRNMMQEYLRYRSQLAAMIQLIDARHDPSREDHEMVRWLQQEELRYCIVATKFDKLRHSEKAPALRNIAETLDLPHDLTVVPYSSHTGEGRGELLAWIGGTIEAVTEA